LIARFRSRSLRVGPGFALLVALTGCLRPPAVTDPVQREFWNSLRVLCGRAFPGTLVRASGADTMLARSPLVLDVWQCYDREVRLAFHVGDDRSRVWLLSPVQSGLRLAHALHRADGSTEEFSEYGGLTRTPGTAGRQEFLADERTVRDVPSAATTVWALELVPRERLTYALRDAAGERFRVDFDLTRTAPHPPTPWGYTRTRGPSPPDSSGS
jgi:hypothetical protein